MSDSDFINLTGIAHPVQKLGDRFVTDEDQAAWFSCTIPFGDTDDDQWLVSLCNIHSAAGGFLSSIDPIYNTSLSYVSSLGGDGWALPYPGDTASVFSNGTVPVGHAYLVLNSTWLRPDTTNEAGNTTDTDIDMDTYTEYVLKVSSTEQDSHWLRIKFSLELGGVAEPALQPQNQTPLLRGSIAASLCFEASVHTKNILTEAGRTQRSNEPVTLQTGLL